MEIYIAACTPSRPPSRALLQGRERGVVPGGRERSMTHAHLSGTPAEVNELVAVASGKRHKAADTQTSHTHTFKERDKPRSLHLYAILTKKQQATKYHMSLLNTRSLHKIPPQAHVHQ